MSASTAGHCREAFKGVSQALREAGLLPAKAPDVAAVMSEGDASATEAEPASA